MHDENRDELAALIEDAARTMAARDERAAAEGRLGPCARCAKETRFRTPWTANSTCAPCRQETIQGAYEVDEKRLAIPKSYRVTSADELVTRGLSAKVVAMADAAWSKDWLVVHGARSGAGKSSLAGYMACRRIASNLRDVAWLPAYKLSGSTWKADDGWTTVDLLIIDDLGAERDFKSSLVPEIVEERRAHDMATWFTTAFDGQQLADKYGEHVARRVYGRSTAILIKG